MLVHFCCKITLVSVCQKLSKYNAVRQSYQYCKNKNGAIFCLTVYNNGATIVKGETVW